MVRKCSESLFAPMVRKKYMTLKKDRYQIILFDSTLQKMGFCGLSKLGQMLSFSMNLKVTFPFSHGLFGGCYRDSIWIIKCPKFLLKKKLLMTLVKQKGRPYSRLSQ